MEEKQEDLEKLLLDHIKNQVVGGVSENDTVSETALALIELWKFERDWD